MDLAARLELVRSFLITHLAALVAVHLAALLLALVLALPVVLEPFRRGPWSQRLGLLGLVAGAFFVRALVIPALTGHVYDGHEADYFDVWRGVRRGLEVGYRASEVLRLIYARVGPWFDGSGRALVVIQLLFSLLTLPLAWLWVRDLTGLERAGLAAAFFLALDPIFSFWASSAYNIQQPFIVGLGALALLERAVRRGSSVTLAASMLTWALAVALRGEALMLALPIVWRLAQHHRLLRTHRGWGAALVLPAVLVAVHLLAGSRAPVGGDTARYVLGTFRRQVLMFDYLEPYGGWLPAALLVGAAIRVWWGAKPLRGVVSLWLAMALSHHLAYAAFDDYDFRHTLVPRLALASIAGTALAIPGGRGWRLAAKAVLLAGITVPLALGLRDMATRYYATPERFFQAEPRFKSAPYLRTEQLEGCVLVAESWFYQSYPRASHFDLLDSQKLAKLEREYPCILFVYDLENFQASSRSIDGRALKIARLFELELLGKRIDRQAESYALIFRVGRR